jgi:hypothetical protein
MSTGAARAAGVFFLLSPAFLQDAGNAPRFACKTPD